jgi:hypothetical protein
MLCSRTLVRRTAGRAALAVVLLVMLAPAASATGAPTTSTRQSDSLYVEYDTLPNDQPGTHDIVDILVAHSVWTENGVVTYDWYNFEIYVSHAVWDADFNIEPGNWAGGYFAPVPVAPVSFGPRSVSATRTLTWRCLTGVCPTMPATIDVTVTARAIGAPRTSTMTGPGSPGPNVGHGQEYDADVTLDTGGAITLPPLVSWAWLQHGWSRTLGG